VEQELARLSAQAPWADQVPFLIQLPGIGLVTAMTILSAIGDITRFPTAKKLVGYSGLGTRIRASGQTHRAGGITHEGRKE
jgi:transposase